MGTITIASAPREADAVEDIQALASELTDNPKVILAAGEEIQKVVREKASALFLEDNLVLALLEPEKEMIQSVREQIESLKARVHVILYSQSPAVSYKFPDARNVKIEGGREERLKRKVLNTLRKYGKKMTDKGFEALREMIRDDYLIEQELMKLINYAGEKKTIDSRAVREIVTQTHEDTMLTLFDAFTRRDRRELVAILDNLMRNGTQPLAIHGYLVKQTRLLSHAKDMEGVFKAIPEYPVFRKTYGKWKQGMELKPIDKRQYLTGQKEYYAFKLSKISEKLSRKDLVFLLDLLTEIDRRLKSGTKYEQIWLENALLNI